jgi:hypothetical protein
MLMVGWEESLECTDPGATAPIGAGGNFPLSFCRKSRITEDIFGSANIRVRTFHDYFQLWAPVQDILLKIAKPICSCKCFYYLFLLQVAIIQYFGTLCIFTNLLNRNLVKIIMLFYPILGCPLMCDIQVKSGFVLNFAKNGYLHNPKKQQRRF